MYNLGFPETVLLFVLVSLLVFEVIMLIDVVRQKDRTMASKLGWVIAILLLHPFAALYYFFTQYRKSSGFGQHARVD